MAERWNGETKTTENLEFTLHYADGTEKRIKDGVLFSLNDDDTMDIHVGVPMGWRFFGVFFCFFQFIAEMGLKADFDEYCEKMYKQMDGGPQA